MPSVNTPDLTAARDLLRSVFGYDDFRPYQAEIIANILARRDTLAVMPTGSGKSLCYQLPALLFDGLTVVVSPLIALMQDQVTQLQELGVPAAFLNSTLDYDSYLRTANRVRAGEIKLLYTSPETLVRPETRVLLDRSRVACLAIDEAHCISQWGHDFRPEYRQLLPVRQRYPAAVCVAFTATATQRVQADIKTTLGFRDENTFIASYNRENLFLEVRPRSNGPAQTLAFLEAHRDQSGIIYCSTRRGVDELAARLQAQGWPVLPYHAGMDDATRRHNQELFSRDKVPIMVATIAFGMGINKSNVRFVLHYNLPESLEHYYQEIGRAGRDGLRADCLLLYSRSDLITRSALIDGGAAAERPGRQARLQAMARYAEARECRRTPLLSYFGETSHPDACGFCDNCLAAKTEVETDRCHGRGAASFWRASSAPVRCSASAGSSTSCGGHAAPRRSAGATIGCPNTARARSTPRPSGGAWPTNSSGSGFWSKTWSTAACDSRPRARQRSLAPRYTCQQPPRGPPWPRRPSRPTTKRSSPACAPCAASWPTPPICRPTWCFPTAR